MLNINKSKWQRVIYKQCEITINTLFGANGVCGVSIGTYTTLCVFYGRGTKLLLLQFERRSLHSNNNLQWFLYKYMPINNKVHAIFEYSALFTERKKSGAKIVRMFRQIWPSNVNIEFDTRTATADRECEWIFQVRYGSRKQNGKVNNDTDYIDYAWLVCQSMHHTFIPWNFITAIIFDHWNWPTLVASA